MTFSQAVMRVKSCRFWKVRERPFKARISGGRPVTSSPSSVTRPRPAR